MQLGLTFERNQLGLRVTWLWVVFGGCCHLVLLACETHLSVSAVAQSFGTAGTPSHTHGTGIDEGSDAEWSRPQRYSSGKRQSCTWSGHCWCPGSLLAMLNEVAWGGSAAVAQGELWVRQAVETNSAVLAAFRFRFSIRRLTCVSLLWHSNIVILRTTPREARRDGESHDFGAMLFQTTTMNRVS